MDLRPSSRVAESLAPAPAAVRRLLTDDGIVLSAAYDPARPGHDGLAFVVAHGFTGSWRRPDSRRIASVLADRGGVVSLDLRGHGRSRGASTVGDEEVHDLDSAVRYARWLGHRRVVTVGFSMGGSVVLRQAALAGEHRPDAVVAVSSAGFWFYQGTAPMRLLHRAVYSRTGRSVLRGAYGTRVRSTPWEEPYPVSPTEAAGMIAPLPLLVVHGDQDPYFPLEHPESIVGAARLGAVERGVPDRTDYWLERGFAHAESGASDLLVERVAGWARQAVGLAATGSADPAPALRSAR